MFFIFPFYSQHVTKIQVFRQMPSHTYKYTDNGLPENIYFCIYHLKSCVWTTKIYKKKTKEPGITFHTV